MKVSHHLEQFLSLCCPNQSRDFKNEKSKQPYLQEALVAKPRSASMKPTERFIAQHAHSAILTQRMTGIPASVTLAQAALESGWGRHAPGLNYFGIKGKGPAGSQWLWTREYRNGRFVKVKAPFRRYSNSLESFLDHARLISEASHFQAAMKNTHSAKAFIHALQSGRLRYATDPQYENKILSIIKKYSLEKYDVRSF